jgi:myosin heavy subunit
VTHARLSPAKADHTRLALCKFVYGKMFDWLVARINKSFSGGKAADDIFGVDVDDANDAENKL